jgi:hypothetical protein
MQATDEYHGRKCDAGAYRRNKVDAVVKAPWQLLLISVLSPLVKNYPINRQIVQTVDLQLFCQCSLLILTIEPLLL